MRGDFPVAEQDIFGYLAEKYTANNQLSCVIALNGKIDGRLLKQAIRLSMKVQPILACRLIENDNGLAWKPRNDLDTEGYYSIIETQDIGSELQKFIITPFDFEYDCQVKVRVFSGNSDTLCVKLHHACTDGGGLKQYVTLLAEIYNQVFNNQQRVVKSSSSYCRGQAQILLLPEISSKIEAVEPVPEVCPALTFPGFPGENAKQIFLTGRLQPGEFASMAEYARSQGGTINDVLLTAYIRSLAKVGKLGNDTLNVNLTVDLRRYLPDRKTEAVANLSGGEFIAVSPISSEAFDATLLKVLQATQKMKQHYPGLSSALSLKRLASLPWKDANLFFQQRRLRALQNNCSIPYFSNLGIISDIPIVFGETQSVECYIVGQALFSPGLILLVSTYDGSLTLAVNFYQSTTPRAAVESLVQAMLHDLRSIKKNNCTKDSKGAALHITQP